jgi:hypothetical protein
MKYDLWSTVECYCQEKTKVLGEKPACMEWHGIGEMMLTEENQCPAESQYKGS